MIYEDAHKSQASDWNFLSKQLFGSNAPDSSSWKDINKIVDILNVIGRTPAYNHMLFHDKGGLDFSHAEFAAETGCIKMYDTIGFCYIAYVKGYQYPQQLVWFASKQANAHDFFS